MTPATATEFDTMKKLLDTVITLSVTYGFQVLGGLVIIGAGWLIAGFVERHAARLLEQRKVDVTVAKFVAGCAKLIVLALAVMAALGKFGVEITPLIAGLSVAGVGAGLALQGTLSNYAAGMSLIFTKPFRVGEIIEVSGVMGEVEDISLGRTLLRRMDHVQIIVPNKHIIGEIVHNYSHLKALDIQAGVSYDTDIDKAVAAIRRVIAQEPKIVQTQEPKIGIAEFADSSITLRVRLWCKQRDYGDALFNTNRGILEAFRAQGIVMPFPQRDVHLQPSPDASRA